MYELAATLQTIDRILTAALAAESAIYQADDWFQAHVVPWVEERVIATFMAFIRGTTLTFIAGQDTRAWFDCWFAGYVVLGIPAVEAVVVEDELLLIEAPKTRIAGLLMPAVPTVIELSGKVADAKPTRQRKPKTETTAKPAPKGRKPAGIAPRKSSTLARVENHVAAIN